jgi:hypothetical protein
MQLSKTQAEFCDSPAHIVQLMGPMGEGKTHAGVAGALRHARRCAPTLDGMPLKGALCRDTHQNIKTSTVQSIHEILGDWVTFKDDNKRMFIHSQPRIEFDLFGIDDPASISKLQGPQYGIIWLEEPAPILERSNAGLPKDVFLMAIARCGRQKGTLPRLQITQNPGDENHWTSELAEDPHEYMVAEDGTVIYKDTFHIRKGDNIHLTAAQRAMNQAAFKGDKGKWDRYVEGLVASVHEGKPVTPGYNPAIHLSQRILPVYPHLDAFRGWDGWGHPCCITAQYNPLGQFVVHDVLYEEGIYTEEIIERKLQPLLALPKYKDKQNRWRDIGDPTMRTPDQGSLKRSAAKVIEQMLKTRFECGPVRLRSRIEPVNTALRRLVADGRPQIILSASASLLHRALRGGWRYKVDNSGNTLGREPVKNEHSHPGDAFASLVATLMPYQEQAKRPVRDREAEQRRITSYAGVTRVSRRPGVPGMM